jgi:hypothetical protein
VPASVRPFAKIDKIGLIVSDMARSRWIYAGAVVITIAIGLASRHFASALPWWLAKNAGDALYATMVYFGLAMLAPRAKPIWIALAAIAFCFAIETLQLYQAPWIEQIRATKLGGLVLGHGFHAFDLACYVIGVGLAVAIELAARRRT